MPFTKYANIAVKLLLAGLLVHLVLFPDLPQYQNKGMAFRLALYPLAVVAVSIVYWVRRLAGRKHAAYPHLIDLLLSFCITFDMLGNTLDLYNSVEWWDDMMHLINTIPLVLAIGITLRARTQLKRLNVAALTLGFGAVCHILWEISEYLTFVPNNPMESPLAYRDTIGDLAMSLTGSLIGAILVSTVLWRMIKSKPRSKIATP